MDTQAPKMVVPRFLLVSDRGRMGPDPIASVLTLARAGLPAFQWREKDLPPASSYDFLCRLAVLLHAAGAFSTQVLVNDRIDIAASLRLGVHLPEDGLPTRVARSILGSDTLIGRSAHSADAAVRAQEDGADYITFGPIFETESKKAYGPPQGLELLEGIASTVRGMPVLAIGGITVERTQACLKAGAHGVAVIGAIWDAPDPVAAWRGFEDLFGGAAS
jgi:thiamine-phosphate pyrophosphorylase